MSRAREATEGKQPPHPHISQIYFEVTEKQMMCHDFFSFNCYHTDQVKRDASSQQPQTASIAGIHKRSFPPDLQAHSESSIKDLFSTIVFVTNLGSPCCDGEVIPLAWMGYPRKQIVNVEQN